MPRRRRAPVPFVLAALLSAAPAAAQNNSAASVPVPPAPAPREDTVGPEQLRDFSLPGTVTRRSEQPAEAAPARPVAPTPQPSAVATQRPAPTQARPAVTAPVVTPVEQAPASAPRSVPSPAPSFDLPPPTPATPTEPGSGSAAVPAAPLPTDSPSSISPSVTDDLPIWPWLLAAALAAVAGGLWLRRRRAFAEDEGRLAFAGAAAEPAPAQAPVPAAAPRAAAQPAPPPIRPTAEQPPAAPAPVGIISSRLRPWVDLEFAPIRALLSDTEAMIEFEISALNSGSVPARQVTIEAIILNAGTEQDEELASFFARTETPDQGIEVIQPLARLPFRSQVRLPRERIREYLIEGRRLFVPLVAFNAAYRWSGGTGRTSLSCLVGRTGADAEKLGPFRLDQGPRGWRDLGARLLPNAVRR